MSFAAECDGDSLDDQSKFHSLHAKDEQVPIEVNNTPRNAARFVIHGRSSGTSSASGSRSNCHTDKLDVLSKISPIMIRVGDMYMNKKALQRHLYRYAISNHFQYKVETSKTKLLHVVFGQQLQTDNSCHKEKRH